MDRHDARVYPRNRLQPQISYHAIDMDTGEAVSLAKIDLSYW